MSERQDLVTGLFVVAALVVFVAGSLWIVGQKPWGDARVSYEVLMRSAGGVRGGDKVRVAGVEVGRVEEVRLAPAEEWPVTFAITLERGIPVTRQASARFASDGLLGSGYLEVMPGPPAAESLEPGGAIHGQATGGLTEALAGMDSMADKAERLLDEATGLVEQVSGQLGPILVRVDRLLSDENLAAASGTLRALRRTSGELGPRLGPLLDRLDGLVAELGAGAREIPGLAGEVKGLAGDLRQVMGEDGEHLTRVLASAEDALGAAAATFSAVEEREGDLEALLLNLRETSANLKSFSQSIKERPSRVLITSRAKDRKPGEGVER